MKHWISSNILLAMMVTATAAFAPIRVTLASRRLTMADIDATTDSVIAEEEVDDDMEAHEELMYTLGINLARQLGDIRPLIENGDELGLVARGLLDTVVGRLSEDDQMAFLAKRGNDVNEMITMRAYVILLSSFDTTKYTLLHTLHPCLTAISHSLLNDLCTMYNTIHTALEFASN